jgi:hypothetical protein
MKYNEKPIDLMAIERDAMKMRNEYIAKQIKQLFVKLTTRKKSKTSNLATA